MDKVIFEHGNSLISPGQPQGRSGAEQGETVEGRTTSWAFPAGRRPDAVGHAVVKRHRSGPASRRSALRRYALL